MLKKKAHSKFITFFFFFVINCLSKALTFEKALKENKEISLNFFIKSVMIVNRNIKTQS